MSSDLWKFVLYADDTNLFISGNSEAEAYVKAQSVLSAIYMTICMLTSFILTLKKVVICILDMNILIKRDLFVLEQTELMIDYFLWNCDNKLKKVLKVKFLGVIVDEKLKWEAHIEHLQKKLKLSIIMVKRVKKFIPKKRIFKAI